MDLIDLLKNPDKCDELLDEIDRIAREANPYEYGLPHDHWTKARMREALYKWAAEGLK